MKKSRFSFLRRPLFWIALVVLIALSAGGAYFYFNQPSARAQTTFRVTRGDLKATVNANGRVQPHTSAKLAFTLSGLVKKVNVQEGDTVQAGQVLAELSVPDVARRLQQAQMNLQA